MYYKERYLDDDESRRDWTVIIRHLLHHIWSIIHHHQSGTLAAFSIPQQVILSHYLSIQQTYRLPSFLPSPPSRLADWTSFKICYFICNFFSVSRFCGTISPIQWWRGPQSIVCRQKLSFNDARGKTFERLLAAILIDLNKIKIRRERKLLNITCD